MEDHVPRHAQMGAWVLINDRWYELADGLTVPGDSEGKCGFVAHIYRNGGTQQIPLSLLPLAVPFVFTRKRPNRIGSRCWTAVFLGKPRRYLGAHRVIDRGRVLAALPKGFEKSLPHRRDGDLELPCPVIDNGCRDRRLIWCNVLDDLERPDPGALVAFTADKQATISRGRQQSGAGRREIRPRIEVVRYPHSVAQNDRVDISVGVDINAAHELNDFPSLGLVVSTGLVEVFTYEIKQGYNFRAFMMRDS